MVIVSQDKTRIFNFDRIDFITICREPNGTCVYVDGNYGTRVLGTYKTEERAKEVLEEIIKNYESKLIIDYNGLVSNEHEQMLMKKYKFISENTNVFISDERKKFQYIPCSNNVYYMPEN